MASPEASTRPEPARQAHRGHRNGQVPLGAVAVSYRRVTYGLYGPVDPRPVATARRSMHVPLLNIPDELLQLRASVRQFIDREIRPLEESHRPEIQETGTFEGITDERLKLRKRSAELGFWTLHMPEEVGGGGLSYLGQVLLHEEASLHGLILAHFESIFPVVTGPTPIYLDCTEAQRDKYLQPLM